MAHTSRACQSLLPQRSKDCIIDRFLSHKASYMKGIYGVRFSILESMNVGFGLLSWFLLYVLSDPNLTMDSQSKPLKALVNLIGVGKSPTYTEFTQHSSRLTSIFI